MILTTLNKVYSTVIFVLGVMELRDRNVEYISAGHTANEWPHQDQTPQRFLVTKVLCLADSISMS